MLETARRVTAAPRREIGSGEHGNRERELSDMAEVLSAKCKRLKIQWNRFEFLSAVLTRLFELADKECPPGPGDSVRVEVVTDE